jgi:ribonuclease HI
LVLGLEATRKLKIKHLIVYGDANIIVKQIKQQYKSKHPRLRSYINFVWDLIENFFSSFNIHSIPIMKNQQADSLAKAVATFVPPAVLKLKYHIEMRHMPLILNNVQHWQVFEDDEQIK